MDETWLSDAVANMRRIGNDTQRFEVKESRGGLPGSIPETLSAFSNGSGGYIILGLSEKRDFSPVEGFDALRIRDALSGACEKLTPVVRPLIEVIPFEGSLVVCARVDEMLPRDKPCFITSRNKYQGSFIRVGDGDRHLTSYEVDRMLDEHRQPVFDDEVVGGASIEDLDATLVDGFVKRQRELHPRLLGDKSRDDILVRLHVLKQDDGALRPTIAGLMALGVFPQQFFPRLNLTFTALPGIDKTSRVSDGQRFLDSQTIVGPIPMMVQDAVAAVVKNMKTGAVIQGVLRRDVPDYPPTAVREAVANALMHRDYSPDSRGSQVQVNMYADRLEILNPGGLYGDVTVDTLGVSGISSARNQFLSNILETTPYGGGGYVVENRGTGYQEIEHRLSQAMMYPPIPKNSTLAFSLTFEKRRLDTSEVHRNKGEDVDEAILSYLKGRTSASTRELVEWSGMSKSTIGNHVRDLVKTGKLEPMEPGRSPKQRYRLARYL